MKKIKPFEWQALSEKQLKVFTWWTDASPYRDYDGIICDGAVRSGKTISCAPSFILWAMTNFSDKDFALCGKTIGALRRNVINNLKAQIQSFGYEMIEHRSENFLDIYDGDNMNRFYCFGGRDESSQDIIQGATLAGVLFDEVALMPQSFVTQAEARCSVSGAKLWYNCNPKAPTHWFKNEYVDIAEEKRLYYLHFLMTDNLTLLPEVRARYERMFTGVFYQRNVLGLWVTAEGKIYTSFTKDHIIDKKDWYAAVPTESMLQLKRDITICTIGIDFGGNKSATAMNLTGFTNNFQHCITLKEKYISKEITPSQLEQEFVSFVTECRAEYPQLRGIYADSAEQVLIRGLRDALRIANIPLSVQDARKGPIIDRIRFYQMMQNQMRYFCLSDCEHTIEAFDNAVWEEDEIDDIRLDDGSTNIDSLDAQEYSTEPFMKAMIDLRRA